MLNITPQNSLVNTPTVDTLYNESVTSNADALFQAQQGSQAPITVPYEAFQRERNLRIQAERERDYWKNEIFVLRKIRRAPALKPVDSAILEEFRHVEKWGKVKDGNGNTRANFTTIAHNLNTSGDTVARHAERLEKLGLVEIREHEGSQDEHERKYVRTIEERIAVIDKLKPDEKVTPKQGGNRYLCTKCDSTDVDIKTITRKKTFIRCNNPKCPDYHVEKTIEDTDAEDSGWIPQYVHKRQKAQKQLAFEKKEAQKQVAEHSVNTGGGYTRVPEEKALQLAEPFGKVPQELKALERFVTWRYGTEMRANGKYEKKPFNPKPEANNAPASHSDVSTCGTFEQAQALCEQSQSWVVKSKAYNGVGFVFSREDGYTGIDLDNCRDAQTGAITDEAQAIIASLNTYTEVSPSETGVKMIARGSLAIDGRKQGDIELYCHKRFFALTGNHLEGTPRTIESRQAQIDALYESIKPEMVAPQPCVYGTCHLSPEQVLEKARNGMYGEAFKQLYDEGKWEHFTKIDKETGEVTPRYPTHNEADLGVCRSLALWCDNDIDMMDRLFRGSQLMRPKWDEKARSGETYGEGTLRRALIGRIQAPLDVPIRESEPEIHLDKEKHLLRNTRGVLVYCSQCNERACNWNTDRVPYCEPCYTAREQVAS